MLQRKHGQIAILIVGILGVLVLAARADSEQPAPLAQQVGRPSKIELLTRCQQGTACRAKLERAQKEQKPATPRPMPQAQSAVSVFLTPQIWKVQLPSSDVELHAVVYAGGRHIFRNDTINVPQSDVTERNPYVAINFVAPVSAFYVISVRATNAAAKLRHQQGGSIIEQWASGSAPCSAGICDYVTIEYLQQGAHRFYFYSRAPEYTFYSASIESYP